MALRMFLVGVVASLALDLPKGETWTRWEARTTESRTSRLEPARVFTPELIPLTAPILVEASVPVPMPTLTPVIPKFEVVEVPAVPAVIVEVEPDMIDPIDMPEVDIAAMPAPAAETPAAPAVGVVDPDATFRASMDQMVSSFAADVAPSASIPQPVLTEVEPLPAVEFESDVDPLLAEILGRGHLTMTPEPRVEVVSPQVVVVEEVIVEEVVVAPAAGEPSEDTSGDRLARAVRLTGQAVNAWASLLQQDSSALSIRR